MQEVEISVVNRSGNPLPEYATAGSSGVDVRAFLDEPVTLQSLERVAIPTGLFIGLPVGYEAQVRPRSGLALNQGLTILNAPGTVDADYRGEIKVILINLSSAAITINNGDRIAQIVFQKVEKARLTATSALSTTARGEGGFGHTGTR